MFLMFSQKKYTVRFLYFFLVFSVCVVFILHNLTSHIQDIHAQSSQGKIPHAQESGSISPTPSPIPSSVSPIPNINPETLRDPDAFKLDQQIKQATRDLFQTTDISIREGKAVQRKNLMKQAIKKYPYVFLGNALTSSQLSSFDTNLQQYFEKPITLSGAELGVTHYDDFKDHKNSFTEYSLQNLQEKKRFNFYPASYSNNQDSDEAFGGHISGTTLNVTGVALDDDISARVANAPQGEGENNDPVETKVEILKEASPDALGPQRIAVIVLKSQGATLAPYLSKEQIEEMILRGEVQQFFKEVSYGKTWFDEEKSKVYGWYEFQTPKPINGKNFGAFIQEVKKITDSDIDFANFDRIILAVSSFETGATSYVGGGRSDIGKATNFTLDGEVKLSFSAIGVSDVLGQYARVRTIGIFEHELGHALGVSHANSWECDKTSLSDNCQHVEYGNTYDRMGVGEGHFNAYFKEVLQWLSPINQSVLDINQSGVYILKPLENKDAVVVKVRRPGVSNSPIYYIEYRKLIGLDVNAHTFDTSPTTTSMLEGIYINWQFKPLRTRLLYRDPPDRLGDKGAIQTEYARRFVFGAGSTFTDEKSGLSITNLGMDPVHDEAKVKVEIEKPECKYYDFDIEINNIYAYEYGSGDLTDMTCDERECILNRKERNDLYFTSVLRVENKNSYVCTDTHLQASLDDPWKIEPGFSQYSLSLPSGKVDWFKPAIFIPTTTSSGIYRINVFVDNVDAGQRIFSTSRDLKIVDELPTLEGDLNNDGKVDIFDLITVARDFGKKGEGFPGDADKNGKVDIFDLVIVAKNFGKKI